MIERHLMKLHARDEISEAEELAIRGAVSEFRDYPADAAIIRAGEELTCSTMLLEGLMCRCKDLSDGQRRITELHVPGDFVDLHSFTLKRLDEDLRALTACRVGIVPHENLKVITQEHPHLTRVYGFSTNLDAAINREWVLSLGQRRAPARMAHLFCEMYERLRIVGLTEGTSFAFDLTQDELSQCLGITPVHVNRTLKELRATGLLDFRGGRVELNDLPAVHKLADFDPGYLYFERRSR
jgi:CRP-like cAMP-binding protein